MANNTLAGTPIGARAAFYTLVGESEIAGREFEVGNILPGDDEEHDGFRVVVYTTDPRLLPVSEIDEDLATDLGDVLEGRTQWQVLRLEPIGVVRLHDQDRNSQDRHSHAAADRVVTDLATLEPHSWVEAESGWTVTAVEPLQALLGPQGDQVFDAVVDVPIIEGEIPELEHIAAAYQAAVERQHDAIGPNTLWDAYRAAEMALTVAGVDAAIWQYVSCLAGNEIMALAARDLIGTTPEWTLDAYHVLTQAWRTTMPHPLHPDDLPPGPDHGEVTGDVTGQGAA